MLILEGKLSNKENSQNILAFKKGKVTSTPAGLRMNGIKWIIVRADPENGTLYLKKVKFFFVFFKRIFIRKMEAHALLKLIKLLLLEHGKLIRRLR